MHGLASLFEIFIDKEGMSKGHSGKSRTADQSKIFTMNILTGYLAFLKAILLAFPRSMECKCMVFRQILKSYYCQRVSVMVIHERIRKETKAKKFLKILTKNITQFLSYFVLFPHIMVYKCIPYQAV